MEIYLESEESTRHLGRVLGELLKPGDVVLLCGSLGAGKTTLAQGLGIGLGVKERITSPTFTLIQEYKGRYPLYHIDLYRLETLEDIQELGLLEDYLGRSGIAVVEWGEKLRKFLPERLEIHLETVSQGGRWARFKPYGQRYQDLVAEVNRLLLSTKS
ncbi:MAG: tRNA (adenosine(37)-N6)-threonylcarbamoyltransferase complex ATPase subunit type 1 TsaE [Thermanaeromonas sp.]|uniref:tRNA (adenosine(37)-N6)-threonylcarbamoyltransferase complex ATPase subunit type 1 TsaE n=1 Tax=Thermanaeromonas sp. TaxID=2003697 RepID=UPI00243EAC1F|nr:tRNA (adenosine(37)-N6)-threonylcarbamoyltransferase complex ATPase subunit type 1 TsaE [Thermanaeromonas sp.]MCG0278760.1 tRNA (adenosine(37)-N6)-threonylcarbamoyltransferase complex ATPase subunit type 1 TsaE [Thermanaeromonas sp.]